MLNYFKILQCMAKSSAGHEQVSLKPMHKERTVTLIFDLATWFLLVTHYLAMIIICTKLLSNPTMHDKVIGQTQTLPVSLNHMQKV